VDWDDLRFALALHQERTLAAAARRLGVEHSTVGRRISALEKELGARIFDHTPDGYLLTPAGRMALAAIERVADAVATLQRRVSGEDSRLEGTVFITAPHSFGECYLAPRLEAFNRRYDDITVVLRVADHLMNLAHREADLAIRMVKPTQPNLLARKLGEIGFAVYGAASYLERHPASPDTAVLDDHDVIGFEGRLERIAAGKWLAEASCKARLVSRSDSLLAIAAMAAGGVGLAVLPAFMAADYRLLRASPNIARSDIWLTMHSDLQRNKRIRAVVDYVAEIIAKDASRLSGRD
jgi:DNA-binding transcriptional LysR family regulator